MSAGKASLHLYILSAIIAKILLSHLILVKACLVATKSLGFGSKPLSLSENTLEPLENRRGGDSRTVRNGAPQLQVRLGRLSSPTKQPPQDGEGGVGTRLREEPDATHLTPWAPA